MRTLADGRAALRSPPSLGELRRRRREIMRIARRHGARNIRVYGSVARGEQNDESDLDLLVDFAPGVSLLGWASLICELEDLLGCAVDVAETASLKERVRTTVLAEAVRL